TLYALPLVGEQVLRWRARLLGPAGVVRATLALCCADPSRIPPDVVEAHVALARERLERMPWANRAFVQAARSLIAVAARRSWFSWLERLPATQEVASSSLVGPATCGGTPAATVVRGSRRCFATDADVDHTNHQEPQHRGGTRRAALVRRRRRGQGPRPPRVAGRVGAAREDQPRL